MRSQPIVFTHPKSPGPGGRPLRIGLVTRQYPPDLVGGIGSYVRVVAQELAAAGHHPVVIQASPGQERSSSTEDGVTIERFPESGPTWLWDRLDRLSDQLTRRLRASVSAARAVRSLPPFDVIEAPEWKAEGLLLRAVRRGPVVVHIHLLNRQLFAANGFDRGVGVRIADAMEAWSARLADAVTASSAISVTNSAGERTLPVRSVSIVLPPIVPQHWAPLCAVEETEPIVLFIGRLEPLKSPETVVHALRHMTPVPGARAIFVGRTRGTRRGQRYDTYLREVAGRDIPIEVMPPVSDGAELRALLSRARVVAVSSRFETLSMVALEAMASARPVILGRRIGAAEFLADPFSAPTVDPDDIEGWAAELHRFLTDAAGAAAAGRANRQRIEQLVPPGAIAASRVAVYRSVIARRQPETTNEVNSA